MVEAVPSVRKLKTSAQRGGFLKHYFNRQSEINEPRTLPAITPIAISSESRTGLYAFRRFHIFSPFRLVLSYYSIDIRAYYYYSRNPFPLFSFYDRIGEIN